jgi:hypothetical protein
MDYEVLFEGLGVVECLEERPYKFLNVGAEYYEEWNGNGSGIFATGIRVFYPVSRDEILIDKEKRTISFEYNGNDYIIRPLTEEDKSWATENDIKECQEAIDGTATFWG